VPPPDVIYSIIREPHHQSPFLSWSYFRDNIEEEYPAKRIR
jgi:hypothetical protein